MNKLQLKDIKHICIIQTAFLGDVALTLPLVQIIKNNFPDVKITFISTPLAAGITSCIPAIDQVLTYDKRGIRKGLDGIEHMASIIRELNVDCIISCHRSFRTSILIAKLKNIYSIGFDISSLPFFYSKRIKYKKSLHEIERNVELLSAFGDFSSVNISTEVIHEIAYEDRTFIDNILIKKEIDTQKLIMLFPGSVWETKRWKKEYFSSLIDNLNKLGFICILNGSADDKLICDKISASTGSVSLASHLTIAQTIHLISLSKLVITNDSAPTHFAFIAGVPALTIYGPTSPMFGFYPRSENSRSVGLNYLKCRPCEIHGGKKCPIGTHECMNNLMPSLVLRECLQILENTAPET